MKRTVTMLMALVRFSACEPTPTGFEAPPPLRAIVDAVHGYGNDHFFWLPPMVDAPEQFNGAFDGTESPVVTICDLADCANAVVAEFTTTTGPGSETVRVEPDREHYIVDWHIDESEVAIGPTYRIRVTVDGVELGLADVQLAATGKDVKNITTDALIGLKEGRTLPIIFRIEAGAVVFTVGSDGGVIARDDGAVVLDIPSDALSTEVGITIEPDVDHPPEEGVISGSAYEFGPDGLTFDPGVTVNLSIAYDDAKLPAGHPETALVIAKQLHDQGGMWRQFPSTVDPNTNTVSAAISGFSNHVVQQEVVSVDVSPAGATIQVGASRLFTATPLDASGNPLSNQEVVWSSSPGGIASETNPGEFVGLAAGTTAITATVGGATGTANLTVQGSAVLAQIGIILSDPFGARLVANLTPEERSAMETTLDQCSTGIGQGDEVAVGSCLATARTLVVDSTDPNDRALLAVFDRLLDVAQRLLNP